MSDEAKETEVHPARFPVARSLRVEELVQLYDQIIDRADADLAESSISIEVPAPNTPEGLDGVVRWGTNNDPLPPNDLTTLASETIGKLFSLMSNWTNYVSGELTRAKCLLQIQERHAKVVEAALRAYYRDEQGCPANRLDEKVDIDERYVRVDASVLRVKVFAVAADARYEGLKRSLTLISREQTRRGEELQRLIHEQVSHPGSGGAVTPAWGRR